eukprot:4990582-Alexandrium_andersonii.AAC.1
MSAPMRSSNHMGKLMGVPIGTNIGPFASRRQRLASAELCCKLLFKHWHRHSHFGGMSTRSYVVAGWYSDYCQNLSLIHI